MSKTPRANAGLERSSQPVKKRKVGELGALAYMMENDPAAVLALHQEAAEMAARSEKIVLDPKWFRKNKYRVDNNLSQVAETSGVEKREHIRTEEKFDNTVSSREHLFVCRQRVF
jgi:hypothetical protein